MFMGCACCMTNCITSRNQLVACTIKGVIQQSCPSGEQVYVQCVHPVPITVSILNTGAPGVSCNIIARLKGPSTTATVTIEPLQQKTLCSDKATQLTIECTGGGVLGNCVGTFEGCIGAVNTA
ncbi:hypothetical protein HNQ34_002058 [Anoxybacillus tepidamans]|uniref:Uncharacterized protein n=1 Tax=Anoxybacteroides tepidamans TaxID=265948 RepID=A0A7W8MV64_9BACL|nr:hypothetical protein [Anoxybacillus tepidamans]